MTQQLRTVTAGVGPNLVLLHGWGLNSGVWESLVPKLVPYFSVTLVDLPGFGLNHDILPDEYNISSISDLLLDAIPSDSILLGWSLGGLIAQHIAISYPNKIKRLVLLCSSPKFKATQEWYGIAESVLSVFHQQLDDDVGKTLERFLAIQAMGSPSAKSDIQQIRQSIHKYPLPHKDALSGGLEILSEVDLRLQLSRITAPTNWFFGRLDSLVPQKVAGMIKVLQPTAKQMVIQKASHAPFISHLDSFVNLLLDELQPEGSP
jgi:pimeloyl-[acyl-carrier protein] methyl ester esterase